MTKIYDTGYQLGRFSFPGNPLSLFNTIFIELSKTLTSINVEWK